MSSLVPVNERITAALDAFRGSIGPEWVVTNPETLRLAETATFATEQRIPVILRPGSRDEVQACVRLARAHGMSLYPTSGGKNWGYGSRVPARSGSALLDLGRLDRIVAFDESLAYVTVEAGVTQQKLARFLEERGSRLWIDTVSSSPDASLVGNTMERGHGLTPYADRIAHTLGFEIVLASGDAIATGYCRFPGSALGPLDPHGLGPSLDGLFVQSNLGVVVKMTLQLQPAPECVRLSLFSLGSDEAMAECLERLRPLRLDGTLRVGPQIWNEYRALQRGGRLEQGVRPLMPEEARRRAAALGADLWNGMIGLYGSRAAVDDQQARVEAALRGVVQRVVFADEAAARAEAEGVPREAHRLFAFITGQEESMNLGIGRAYWRKPPSSPTTFDLDKDGCGFLWCAPLVPFRGSDAASVSSISRRILLEHGFEPDVAMVSVRERVLHFHISLVYDRDAPGEDARALSCHDELSRALADLGYLPYRLGVQSMTLLERGDDTYRDVLARLKSALDPEGVLAPGRYVPEGGAKS